MPDLDEQMKAALADHFAIERELGSGGKATVYLAHDLNHQRQVAVKVMKPELAAALGSERFLRKIQITAQLNHPHILPLLDSGAAEGFLFGSDYRGSGRERRGCGVDPTGATGMVSPRHFGER